MDQQLAALDIYTIVYELQDLIGSYIDKIYQLSTDEVIIRINNRKTKQKEILYAHSNGFFYRTQNSFETPMKPTTFAMTLRKYISNGRITEIIQHEFDRIIKIKIQKREEFTLLFELIPNGNIMLLNQNQKIITPLKHQEWSQRSIRTRLLYQPPTSQVNPFRLSEKECDQLIQESDADLVRTVAVKLSLGGRYAEEFCSHLHISKDTPAKNLTEKQRQFLFKELQSFLQRFENHQFNPTLVIDKHKKEMTPFPFAIHKNKKTESVNNFSKGLQKIISPQTEQKNISPVEQKKGKLIRQKNQQEKAINNFDKKIQQKKHQGDTIYLHYPKIEELINQIQENRKLFSKKELSNVLNQKEIIKNFSPDSPILTLVLPDEHKKPTNIQIDYRKSVAENAERSYEQSKKLGQKKQGAIKALKQTKEKINALNQQAEKQLQKQSKQEKQKQDVKKHFWFEQYRWCIATTGNLIIGGKDAKSNDQLVKKHLEKGDRYAHVDMHGAPSCIVKNKNIDDTTVTITEQSLEEGCVFSACYSRSWKQFAEAQAYWVLPEQVSKTPQSGEFVPKGAFIIRGKRNYCTCKMQLGIGSISIHNTQKIMGGPLSAVKKWCNQYVIIEPGTKKSSSIAKEIAEVLNATTPQVQQVLPPGESRIISISKK
jgi:predicted ribosome quality control (RQC) complex YloA/Tae2 family protein